MTLNLEFAMKRALLKIDLFRKSRNHIQKNIGSEIRESLSEDFNEGWRDSLQERKALVSKV